MARTTKTQSTDKRDVAREAYEQLTALMIEALESGKADPAKWVAPWRAFSSVDRNIETGNRYRGGNALLTSLTRFKRGYEHAAWSTYNGWGKLGRQVRKGERGLLLFYWNFSEKTVVAADGSSAKKRSVWAKGFTVFNYAQTDALADAKKVWEPTAGVVRNPDERIAEVDELLGSFTASYAEGGDRAFYAQARDHIQLPAFADFNTALDFASTALHELAHSTGHTSRLNRTNFKAWGDESYAAEELVAELSAAFSLARLGLTSDGPREDHQHYIASWLRALRNDSKAVWDAAQAAQKATDLLLDEPAAVETDETEAEPVETVGLLARNYSGQAGFMPVGEHLQHIRDAVRNGRYDISVVDELFREASPGSCTLVP